jgi:uncharacterized protein YbaA (DUF1428 family)
MYVDGFLIPVPNARKAEYVAHEDRWWPYFRDLGAETLVVGWGDDVPAGTHTDFHRAVDLHPGETTVFCWMTWPDKATRDAAYRTMMSGGPDAPGPGTDMPFDGKRMVYGGFTPVLVKG